MTIDNTQTRLSVRERLEARRRARANGVAPPEHISMEAGLIRFLADLCTTTPSHVSLESLTEAAVTRFRECMKYDDITADNYVDRVHASKTEVSLMSQAHAWLDLCMRDWRETNNADASKHPPQDTVEHLAAYWWMQIEMTLNRICKEFKPAELKTQKKSKKSVKQTKLNTQPKSAKVKSPVGQAKNRSVKYLDSSLGVELNYAILSTRVVAIPNDKALAVWSGHDPSTYAHGRARGRKLGGEYVKVILAPGQVVVHHEDVDLDLAGYTFWAVVKQPSLSLEPQLGGSLIVEVPAKYEDKRESLMLKLNNLSDKGLDKLLAAIDKL